jgi:hypothetical protein
MVTHNKQGGGARCRQPGHKRTKRRSARRKRRARGAGSSAFRCIRHLKKSGSSLTERVSFRQPRSSFRFEPVDGNMLTSGQVHPNGPRLFVPDSSAALREPAVGWTLS